MGQKYGKTHAVDLLNKVKIHEHNADMHTYTDTEIY